MYRFFRQAFRVSQEGWDLPEKLHGAIGQLRVWAENVGAHRHGSLSLDHRLREASSFKGHVKALLVDLDDVLKESKFLHDCERLGIDNVAALGMVSGKLKPPPANDESELEDKSQTDSESPEDLPHQIASRQQLMRFAILSLRCFASRLSLKTCRREID